MKHCRFVALFSSVLLIMSLILCIAVPAFAAETDSYGLVGDWVLNDELTRPDTWTEQAINFVCKSASYVKILFRKESSYGGYFINFGTANNTTATVYGFGTSGGSNDGYWTSGLQNLSFGADTQYITTEFYEWFIVNATPNESSENPGQVVFPPKPPLVAATEGVNLKAVMSQVVAILPIGLGCLVGYLGLRIALAFFRRILSGA